MKSEPIVTLEDANTPQRSPVRDVSAEIKNWALVHAAAHTREQEARSERQEAGAELIRLLVRAGLTPELFALLLKDHESWHIEQQIDQDCSAEDDVVF